MIVVKRPDLLHDISHRRILIPHRHVHINIRVLKTAFELILNLLRVC